MENLPKFIIGTLVVGVIIVIGIFVFSSMQEGMFADTFGSTTDTILTESTSTISPLYGGITSSEVKANNNTWLDFDGVDDLINIEDSDDFNFNQSGFTVSGWINGRHGGVISKYRSTADNREWGVLVDTTNKLFFAIRPEGTSSPSMNLFTLSKTIINDTWQFITVSYNESGASIYVDGFLETNNTYSNGVFEGISDITVGRSYQGTPNSYNGSIDELKIYNRSLNIFEINDIYINSSRYDNNVIPVIYFHGINGNNYWDIQNASLFEEMMGYLNSSGYTTITTAQLKNITTGDLIVEKPIVLINDDGDKSIIENRSTYEKYGFHISIAISTSQQDGNTSDYINWDETLNLSNSGHEIIAHGYDHTSMTDYNYTKRIEVFNNTKNFIYDNVSVIPSTFVFPKNVWNSTIMVECSAFYDICTADDGNGYFDINETKLNNGEFNRMDINNQTTLYEFTTWLARENSQNVDENNNVMDLNLNENNGTIAHDSSDNSNDGTLIGVPIWTTNGILVTLTALTDYIINPTTGLFTIVNSDYSWSELVVSYNYKSTSKGVGYSTLSDLINALSGGTSWIAILIIVGFATIIIGFLSTDLKQEDMQSKYSY